MSTSHTPTPWSVDTERSEGSFGDGGPDERTGFDAFSILDADGRVLFDSLNRDGSASEIHEERDSYEGHYSAWDAKAKADAARIVHCVNLHDELAWIVNGFLEWHEGSPYPERLIERARIAVPTTPKPEVSK